MLHTLVLESRSAANIEAQINAGAVVENYDLISFNITSTQTHGEKIVYVYTAVMQLKPENRDYVVYSDQGDPDRGAAFEAIRNRVAGQMSEAKGKQGNG